MADHSMSLEDRVALLERGLRRWKLFAGGVTIMALAAIGIGATVTPPNGPVAEVIRAKRFEVIGAGGNIQAALGTVNNSSDYGMLRLFDDQGKERFTARTGENETFVYVLNDKQEVGLTAYKDPEKGAGISISTTEPNGTPYGKVVWKAP